MKLFHKRPDKTRVDEEEMQAAAELLSTEQDYGAFLQHFLKPTKMHSHTSRLAWEEEFEEPYTTTLHGCISTGDLRQAGVAEGLQLLTVAKLKEILKSINRPTSGNKSTLIQILILHDPILAAATAEEHATDVYVVTDKGRAIVESYLANRAWLEQKTLDKAINFLQNSDVRAACKAINHYYKWLPKPLQPGLGVDYAREGVALYADRVSYLLKHAQQSWIIAELPKDTRQPFIIAAAIFTLWPSHVSAILQHLNLPGDTTIKRQPIAYLRLLESFAANAITANEAGDDNLSIYTCNDDHVCSVCQSAAKKTYTRKNAPTLPHQGCTNPDGCRCFYVIK